MRRLVLNFDKETCTTLQDIHHTFYRPETAEQFMAKLGSLALYALYVGDMSEAFDGVERIVAHYLQNDQSKYDNYLQCGVAVIEAIFHRYQYIFTEELFDLVETSSNGGVLESITYPEDMFQVQYGRGYRYVYVCI